jgi:hypothetical protein
MHWRITVLSRTLSAAWALDVLPRTCAVLGAGQVVRVLARHPVSWLWLFKALILKVALTPFTV